jgi:hypothetical protein
MCGREYFDIAGSAGYHFTGVRRAHNYCRVFPSIARPIDLTREQRAVSHFHGYSLIDNHNWVPRATQSSGLRRSSFICIFKYNRIAMNSIDYMD